MMETLIRCFEKYLSMMSAEKDWRVRKSFYDQAFGALTLAIQMCGSDWDEADKYVEMWNNEWKERLEAKVYEV
jgi:hypothetical protein